MSHVERSYERLRQANPNPTVEVVGRMSAEEMLGWVEGGASATGDMPSRIDRHGVGRGTLVAAAAFMVAVVLVVPVLLLLAATRGESPDVTVPPARTITTTVATSTVPTETTAATPSALDAGTQADVDRYVDLYNAGDVEVFMAFLAPDFRREVRRDRDDTVQTLETVRRLYEIDAVLDTEITLTCRRTFGSLQCDVVKYNDLNRVLGNPPARHWTIILEFRDGRLLRWFENRLNVDTEYDAQVRTFMAWVRETHPEAGELFPFVAGDWITRQGAAQEVARLVGEWAASRGVDLDER